MVAGRLTILLYHRVRPTPDPLFPDEVDVDRFDVQMRLLSRYFRPVALADAIAAFKAGRVPPRAVAVTFDDGYRDNLEVAAPIMQRYGVPGTFFVATDYLRTTGAEPLMWNDRIIEGIRSAAGSVELPAAGRFELVSTDDRRRAVEACISAAKYLPSSEREVFADEVASHSTTPLPRDLMMSPDQLRALATLGMEIGGHTCSHPILASVADHVADHEIEHGRRVLQRILGSPIRGFAYPNGMPGKDYDARHVDMVRRAGYEFAVSTATGHASASSDLMQLPRFTPWDRSPVRFVARLAANFFSAPGTTTI